jgi:parvulin-like peptidyl-prolyl isomerase
MTPLGKFSLRLALYGLVIAYIAGDLFVFNGPLRQKMDLADPGSAQAIAAAKANGVVARVFNLQIKQSQLERAVAERLWLEGKTLESIPPETLKTVRYAALDDLIAHELLRVKAKVNATELIVAPAEVDERLRRLLGRFENKTEMETAMKSQGIASEQDLRERITARIQQERYVESKIGPLATVTEKEARDWFEENHKSMAIPERVRARHVFIPTLDVPPEDAKATLDAALSDLTAKTRDFATLAREVSQDPATRETGGDLGWMTRNRLPVDFSTPVFSLPLDQPALVRTRLGWHLVEVTAKKPAGERTFEQAKDEVIAALTATKRHAAAAQFRDALRRFEAAKIDIYHDMIQP